MKKLLFLFLLISSVVSGQDEVFKVGTTADTLYIGNPVGVKYTFENVQGDFQPPQFEGFDIVGGPNVSNQFSMINGEVTQSSSYEYYLMPRSTGTYTIGEATLENDEGLIHSDLIDIVVIDNPQGLQQSYTRYDYNKTRIGHRAKARMTKSDSLRMKLRKIKSTKI